MNPFGNLVGNLVVNLLMLALGLGSFKIVAMAIFRGVAQGASSATFPFATKPFGFLLVVGAWLGLGILMLYAAWRGVVEPQDPDHDDVQDSQPTVPQPRRAGPSEPAARGAFETQPGSTGSFDQFVQRAKSPASMALRSGLVAPPRAATTSAESRPSTLKRVQLPETLHLYKSRVYAGTWLLVMTFFTVAIALGTVVLSGFFGQKLATPIFALLLAIYLMVAVKCVRDWLRTEPALSLEKYGITDHCHGGRYIPWTDVKGVRLSSPSATTYLVLQFAHAELVQTHFGSSYLPHAVLQRIFFSGFEARIALTSLSFKRAQLMQVSQAFLRHARR